MIRKAFLGFYWTLPVTWAGFRNLPSDVEGAAKASRTIRYQRERVRCHVQEVGGELVAEIAFMDVRTDRATAAVKDVLRIQAAPFAEAGVSILAVAFHEEMGWRNNPFLHQAADALKLDLVPLSPIEMCIDGQWFDPVQHFRSWRKADEATMARLEEDALAALRVALEAVPEGRGRWDRIAALLNEQGARTIRGGRWTGENVRKLNARRL